MKSDFEGHIIELNEREAAAYLNSFSLRKKVFDKAMRIFDETGYDLTVVVVDAAGVQIDVITTETNQPQEVA